MFQNSVESSRWDFTAGHTVEELIIVNTYTFINWYCNTFIYTNLLEGLWQDSQTLLYLCSNHHVSDIHYHNCSNWCYNLHPHSNLIFPGSFLYKWCYTRLENVSCKKTFPKGWDSFTYISSNMLHFHIFLINLQPIVWMSKQQSPFW